MGLSAEDRDWLTGQFDRVHERVNKTQSDAAHNKQELIDRINATRQATVDDVKAHEEKHHDPMKRIGFLGGVVTVILGLWEVLKLAVAAVKKGQG